MTLQEREIEKKFRALVEKHGGHCLKFVSPMHSGVPDRIALLPGGRVIFVELKKPKGGKLSKLQQLWRDRLQALGLAWWLVCDAKSLKDAEEVLRVMTAYDDIVKRTENAGGQTHGPRL